MLVTAALYLVIGQVIPFVGYLSTFDQYFIITFVILIAAIGIHFYCSILRKTADKHPMNRFIEYFIITVLKVIWIPLTFLLFFLFFETKHTLIVPLFSALLVIFCFTGLFQLRKLKGLFYEGLTLLRTLSEDKSNSLSPTEKIFLKLTSTMVISKKKVIVVSKQANAMGDSDDDSDLEL